MKVEGQINAAKYRKILEEELLQSVKLPELFTNKTTISNIKPIESPVCNLFEHLWQDLKMAFNSPMQIDID